MKRDNCIRRFREIKKNKSISPIKEQGVQIDLRGRR